MLDESCDNSVIKKPFSDHLGARKNPGSKKGIFQKGLLMILFKIPATLGTGVARVPEQGHQRRSQELDFGGRNILVGVYINLHYKPYKLYGRLIGGGYIYIYIPRRYTPGGHHNGRYVHSK